MSCLLYLEDEEAFQKVNIDELYEKDQRRDQRQLSIFNKILNRIHKRITVTNRNKRTEKYAFFTVPEYIFGEPVYDKGDCIAYLITKLEMNGFFIKYMHPNTLFISWENWVPSYVRHELKKKTGIVVDEKGNIIDKQDGSENSTDDINSKILNDKTGHPQKPESKKYTSIGSYKSTGSLVYNPEMFEKIEKRVNM